MLFNKSRKKVNDEHEHDEEADEVEEKVTKATMPMTLFMPPAGGAKDESRTIGLFGEVEEAKISQIVGVMLELAENCEAEYPANPDDPESEILTENEPIEFIINIVT
jgi:hypothetical protein